MPDRADLAAVVRLLRSVPLFSNLDREHLDSLATSAVERTYPPGELVVPQGETGVGFFLIADGRVAVERSGKVVATLGPGEFFGEMALIYQQSRTADVRALDTTRCLVLSPSMFWGAVGDDTEALKTLLRETVRRLRQIAPGPED